MTSDEKPYCSRHALEQLSAAVEARRVEKRVRVHDMLARLVASGRIPWRRLPVEAERATDILVAIAMLGRPATSDDLVQAVGITGGALRGYMEALERRGLLRRGGGITLTGKGRARVKEWLLRPE